MGERFFTPAHLDKVCYDSKVLDAHERKKRCTRSKTQVILVSEPAVHFLLVHLQGIACESNNPDRVSFTCVRRQLLWGSSIAPHCVLATEFALLAN